MSHLYPNYSSYWNPNEHRISESLSNTLSLKVDSPPQLRPNGINLGFQLQDQDSSSSQSTHSNHDLTATAATNSQDQCISSESGQEVTGGKNMGGVKPVYNLMGQPENAAHSDYNRSLTCMPYPCGDPYFGGMMTAYGPTPVIQPQMMGLTSARVPLPLDISEDEPIYVNAKQYHGILRRRQSRAKLEAQNKLIKARKPYLHESRHLHALNRVRGSGGRFLSTKKQQSESNSTNNGNHHSRSNNSPLGFDSHHQSQYMESGGSYYQQADNGSFLGISSGGGGFMNGSNQHCASVVR